MPPARTENRSDLSTARLDAGFQKLLLRFSAMAAEGGEFQALIRELCSATRGFFKACGVYFWTYTPDGMLEGTAADGHMAAEFIGQRRPLDNTSASGLAIHERKAVYVNEIDPERMPLAATFRARAIMAAPLILGGEPIGAITFIHTGERQFNDDMADKATVLAAAFGSVLEGAKLADASREAQAHRRRAESLMSLALELNSSLRLPEFVRGFTVRACDMLGARAGALALAQRSALETVILHDATATRASDRQLTRRLNLALSDLTASRHDAVICGPSDELLGSTLAAALGWKDITLARLTVGDEELLGVLVLADRGGFLTDPDRQLLQALCGHAAVALENARLFSRIAQSNRQWAEIFDAITDFIVVHDESHKVLRVNRSLADFIGIQPPELIGIGMRALLAMATDPGNAPCPFCRAGQEHDDEYVRQLVDRTYLVSTSRIHGALHEGLQTIHVLKDITDRREAERRYREIFDNIQEGLFFTVPEGRFVDVNDAMVRMLGYDSREELLQVDIPSQLYLRPEDRGRFREALEQGNVRNYEEVLRRKDGSLIHTLQNAFAVRDAEGKMVQYRGLMLDITELKTFQTQLQRERDFNNKILDNTQSLIVVLDTAGLISYANRRCFQAGLYKEDQFLGRRLAELVAPARRSEFGAAFEATLAGHQVDNLELQLARGDSTTGHFSMNLSPMRDEQGAVNSIVIVMTDVTDAAILQAKLMHTEKLAAVGQLVSGVAHEVNNPLTAILGFSDLLQQQPDVPEKAKRDVRVIVQEAQRTKTIVQNLLSFARQVPPQREPVQLNLLLRRTVQLRSYDFSNHSVEVREHFTEPLPEVIGDAHQLQQVFLNILNNAYDAVLESGREGVIEIGTEIGERWVEVTFRDNGNGIEQIDRIFDPFFTTKEVGKGTGLGLSICYGIVREHGGEILGQNNSGREGATFVVRLPLAPLIAAGGQA